MKRVQRKKLWYGTPGRKENHTKKKISINEKKKNPTNQHKNKRTVSSNKKNSIHTKKKEHNYPTKKNTYGRLVKKKKQLHKKVGIRVDQVTKALYLSDTK